MAKSSTGSTGSTGSAGSPKNYLSAGDFFKLRLKEVGLLMILAAAVFMLVALGTYHPSDPGWSHSGNGVTLNAAGKFGAFLADSALSMSGFFGYFIPFIISLGVWVLYKQERQRYFYLVHGMQVLGLVGVLVFGSVLSSFVLAGHGVYLPQGPGGILGEIVLNALMPELNHWGSLIMSLAGFFIGLTLLSGLQWVLVIQQGMKGWWYLLKASWSGLLFLKYKWDAGAEARALKKSQKQEARSAARALKLAAKFGSNTRLDPAQLDPAQLDPAQLNSAQAQGFAQKIEPSFFARPNLFKKASSESENLEALENLDQDLDEDLDEDLEVVTTDPFADLAEEGDQMDLAIPSSPKLSRVKPEKSQGHPVQELSPMTNSSPIRRHFKGKIPSIELLDDPEEKSIQVSEQALAHMACLLEEKLVDFGITAKVVGVCPGPVVTRYELQLAPGMKVSKLSNLNKDLARSLSAISVRIVEVIPGKPYVGIEIPNEKRQIVRLKEVLKSKAFTQPKMPLLMALGKDISGEAEVVNLEKMPHLLVAGTTGSGKSVGLNAMLLSMLFKATPDELRLIMIDPKMLELSIYEGIPHLLTPVVTDMKEAANALRWCVKEMDRRYRLMASLAVRNLAGYNQKVTDAIKAKSPIQDPIVKQLNPNMTDIPTLEPMPCIVVLVDEFADMMMVVGKKVEELIARLAQKARAAGIHLILATQRPSVDVITGLIKANIPTRMAFQVSSKIDSRTILDQQGAEQLLGHGDMLYLPPGAGVPTRVHGAFVADHEVHKVVQAWKELGEPEYIDSILQTSSSDDPALGESEDDEDYEQDELYDEAVNLVIESGRASISMVQRRLKIGYNRSARLLEAMEAAGIVSEVMPNGMRELLVNNRPD